MPVNGTVEVPYTPNLPFSEVQAYALDVAEMIESKLDEAIEYILPINFKEIAEKKSKSLLKSNTGL